MLQVLILRPNYEKETESGVEMMIKTEPPKVANAQIFSVVTL